MSHSYINPSEKQDLSHLEAGMHEDEELDGIALVSSSQILAKQLKKQKKENGDKK